jgi:hypothetical protein
MYDPRVGRWWSKDALAKMYVSISPYVFSLNNTVCFRDYNGNVVVDANGNPIMITITKKSDGSGAAILSPEKQQSYVDFLENMKISLLKLEIECVVDLDPHQKLGAALNAGLNCHRLSDPKNHNFFESAAVDPQPVSYPSKQIGLDGQGNTLMTGHHSCNAQTTEFPSGIRYSTQPIDTNKEDL